MNAALKNYKSNYRMAVVADSEDKVRELREKGTECALYEQDKLIFYPDGYEVQLDEKSKEKLQGLSAYDIIEISPNGLLYRSFANLERETTLFMGAACNSNCIMCPASDAERKTGNAYSADNLFKYIDYLPEDIPSLVITGGEPTMNRELFLEALRRVKEKFENTYVLMLTNGRSLSNKALSDAVALNRPAHFRVAIPIHGHTAELHDRITRVQGSFEQTKTGIKRMLARRIPVEIRIVVTKLNCEYTREISELILKEFPGIVCVNFIGLEPLGNCALNFKEVFLGYEESFQFCRSAVDLLVKSGVTTALYNYPLCAVDSRYWPICAKSISTYKNGFVEGCKDCAVYDICPGFFDSALRFVKPKISPVEG